MASALAAGPTPGGERHKSPGSTHPSATARVLDWTIPPSDAAICAAYAGGPRALLWPNALRVPVSPEGG